MLSVLSAVSTIAFAEATDFFGNWLAGWNVGSLVLIIIGVALIIVEMLIPGFGIAGVSGGVACIIGLIVGSNSFGSAMFTLAILFLILFIAAIIIFKVIFGKGKRPSRIVLKEEISRDQESVSSKMNSLVGKEGIALTALHPSGIALIDGKRMDVLAEGEFIAKDDSIIVSEVRDMRISVIKKA